MATKQRPRDAVRVGIVRSAQREKFPQRAIDSALEKLFPTPSPYLEQPALWFREKLKRHLWSTQVKILEAVRDHRMVAVQSCHGPGKSFTASGVVAWWLDCHPLGSAFAITTAPSWPQVEAILWREIKRRYNEGKLRGRITLDCQWHMGLDGTKRADSSEELIAMGRKPADYDENTFQGIHARNFLAVLDEACGIPESLWTSVLALATNENARILAIGNPDDPNSRFAKVCAASSDWHVIKIPVWETPLFTHEVCKRFEDEYGIKTNRTLPDEDVPQDVAEGLVSPMWVRDRIKDFGIGSPVWTSKIDGEFPDVSDEYLISPALMQTCYDTELPGLDKGRYGCDIARKGVDKSVMYRNRGGVIRLVEAWAKMDTMESAGKIAAVLKSHGLSRVPAVIDIIGVGAGVFDRLREQRFNVAPHQGSQRALNPAKFKNRRSEVWWSLREMMYSGDIDLDPADEKLYANLTSIKWGIDSSGRIFVETKEDMEERGLPSPDYGDAAVMSCINTWPGMPMIVQDPSITSGLTKRVI